MDIPLFGGTDKFWKHSGWSSQIQRLDLKVVWSSPTDFGSGRYRPGVEATAPVLGPAEDHEGCCCLHGTPKAIGGGRYPLTTPPRGSQAQSLLPQPGSPPLGRFFFVYSPEGVVTLPALVCRLRPQILVWPSLAAPAPHPRAHTEKGEVVHHPPCHLCPGLWGVHGCF